jgi:hypothetical protein
MLVLPPAGSCAQVCFVLSVVVFTRDLLAETVLMHLASGLLVLDVDHGVPILRVL